MAQDNLKLEIKQVFDAPIEKVWDAWTNPNSLKQWMAPENMDTPDAEVDLKVGGNLKIVMQGEGGKNGLPPSGIVTANGKYSEIEEKKKLVFSWLWEGQPEETHKTQMTVLLNKLSNDKTEVTLIHENFADENMKNEHMHGWTSTFKKLKKFLE